MRKNQIFGIELLFVATLTVFIAIDLFGLRHHIGDPQMHYAFSQMRRVTMFVSVTLLIVWTALRFNILSHLQAAFPNHRSIPWIIILIVLFTLVWAPVSASSDYAHDDWSLLAAASVRTTLFSHPLSAWFALDSVDGNFRPLTTSILFSNALHWFGLNSAPFLALNFVINLTCVLLLFAIARSLKLSYPAATLAASLYLSRGLLYTLIAWPCAVGDGIVILLMAAIVLLILHAHDDSRFAVPCHIAAWCLFCCALLAKQSAFAIPGIVFFTLLLAPAQESIDFVSRLRAALLSLIAYLPPVLLIYLHSRSLLRGATPYPIHFAASAILHLFAYTTWYGFMLIIGRKYLNNIPWVLGILLTAAIAWRFRHYPRLHPDRSRLLLYLLCSAVVSIAMFVMLPDHARPYYGAMLAFWVSIALAVLLLPLMESHTLIASGNRYVQFACALVLIGFINISLAQTCLINSGGFITGTYSGFIDRNADNAIAHVLSPGTSAAYQDVVIVTDHNNADHLAAMVLLHQPPATKRLLVYDPDHGWLANDREGLRPGNAPADFTDVDAYRWRTPLTDAQVRALLENDSLLWLFISLSENICVQHTSRVLLNIPSGCK